MLDTQAELESERRRVLDLENRLGDLQDGLSLASFSKHSDLGSSPADPCHHQQQSTDANNNSLLPPIRPPTTLAPPPPPPTALQLKGMSNPLGVPKKSVPKSNFPLKTLNWISIPMNKLKGTIWEKMDDEKLYKQVKILKKSFYII